MKRRAMQLGWGANAANANDCFRMGRKNVFYWPGAAGQRWTATDPKRRCQMELLAPQDGLFDPDGSPTVVIPAASLC
jgi:hypothetical protein